MDQSAEQGSVIDAVSLPLDIRLASRTWISFWVAA